MTDRLEKINQFLQQEISDILEKNLSSLREEIVVSRVKTSADLKSAKVLISFLRKENKEKILSEIENLKNRIQRELRKRISFKYNPKLDFQVDDSFEKIIEIEEIFKNIEKEKNDRK